VTSSGTRGTLNRLNLRASDASRPRCLGTGHGIVHFAVVGSQAYWAGQSVTTWQPQAPATHAVPFRLPVQSAHTPDPPHAVRLVPGSHFPAPQQPVRHGSAGNEHEKMHTPVVLSHPALTGGHSVVIEHPHVPPPATG
jgi:hypothetical protein